MNNYNEIYMLTMANSTPPIKSYTANEETNKHWEVNTAEKKHRTNILLSKLEENESMDAYVKV